EFAGKLNNCSAIALREQAAKCTHSAWNNCRGGSGRLHDISRAGAQADVAEKIRTLGANLLVVMPGAQSSGGARLEAGTQATLTEEDASAIRRELNDVLVAAPLLAHSAHIVARGKNWATNIAGITTDYLIAREWRLSSGRPFTESEL